MHRLHELKNLLIEELEQYGEKDKLDVGGLDIVDKLAHAIKNIDKILEADGYSGRMDDGRYMRRYSRSSEDMINELRRMMDKAPDEQTKREIQRLVSKLEQM